MAFFLRVLWQMLGLCSSVVELFREKDLFERAGCVNVNSWSRWKYECQRNNFVGWSQKWHCFERRECCQCCTFIRTWFSRHGGVGVTVGLGDLRGLFQPS